MWETSLNALMDCRLRESRERTGWALLWLSCYSFFVGSPQGVLLPRQPVQTRIQSQNADAGRQIATSHLRPPSTALMPFYCNSGLGRGAPKEPWKRFPHFSHGTG